MPSSKGSMKYHENHQKRALSVIIAVSSKNKLFVRGLSPTSKSMALAHLDPVAAFGRKTRGGCGSWCVCVWGCAGFEANGPGVCCVCVVDASKNMQGTGFEAKRIVPALPGTLSVCVYVCLYIYMCTCVRACVCVCVCVSLSLPSLLRRTTAAGRCKTWRT